MAGRSPEQIQREIDALQVELAAVAPAHQLSVRKIAKIAGISPATAHRFKNSKELSISATRKLVSAGLIKLCPCCGQSTQQETN